MTGLPCSRAAPQGRPGKQTASMNTKEQPKETKRKPKSAEGGAALPPTPIAEGFMDKRAVAERLGVRPRTVGEWAKQGKIPAYRIGNYLRFKWAEIESHLAQSCRVRGSEMGGQHA